MASDQIHIGGLASGMDTQATIDKLVALKAKPLTTMESKMEGLQADVDAWTDVNSVMSTLTSALDDLRKWETWNQMTSTSSDTTKLTATASSSAVETTYSILIDHLAQSHTVGSNQASVLTPGGTSTTDLVAAGVLTTGTQFTIEGQTITIGATESLSSLRTKINSAAASMPATSRVFASILDNRLVISRNNTGSTQIAMSDATGSPLQALGVLTGAGGYQNELLAAQDAQFTVNGATVIRSKNTELTDVIENVSLNLKEATGATPVTLTIVKDKETAKTAILAFIEAYNAAAAKMTEYGKVTLVGSGAKGAELSSVGELQDDSLIRTLLTNIRKQATASEYPYLNQINAAYTYNGHSGICKSLSDIGVWTEGKDNEIAVTDQDRLDYMMENNFDKVSQLFRGIYDEKIGYTHGIASDFYRYMDSATAALTGDIDRRISALNDQIDDLDEQAKELEDSLDEYEQQLWQQFGTMEEAVSKMQGDLAYLQGALK
jgi:flagellar hook-associated protein 2